MALQRPPGWQSPVIVQPKQAGIAILLSFLIPGVGSMYAGEPGRGTIVLVIWLVTLVVAAATLGLGLILTLAVWIWGMVTANGASRRWNARHGILS